MTPAETKKPQDDAGPPVEVLIVDNDQSHAEVVAESLERELVSWMKTRQVRERQSHFRSTVNPACSK